MYTLFIFGSLPNLNDYTKACRSNKYVGAKMKKQAESHIISHIKQQIPDVRYEYPVKLSFRWYEKDKRRDLDNICFAKKFILDALVKAETIKTDSWQGVIGFTDEFYIDKENPRIEVDIEEVAI